MPFYNDKKPSEYSYVECLAIAKIYMDTAFIVAPNSKKLSIDTSAANAQMATMFFTRALLLGKPEPKKSNLPIPADLPTEDQPVVKVERFTDIYEM